MNRIRKDLCCLQTFLDVHNFFFKAKRSCTALGKKSSSVQGHRDLIKQFAAPDSSSGWDLAALMEAESKV